MRQVLASESSERGEDSNGSACIALYRCVPTTYLTREVELNGLDANVLRSVRHVESAVWKVWCGRVRKRARRLE